MLIKIIFNTYRLAFFSLTTKSGYFPEIVSFGESVTEEST